MNERDMIKLNARLWAKQLNYNLSYDSTMNTLAVDIAMRDHKNNSDAASIMVALMLNESKIFNDSVNARLASGSAYRIYRGKSSRSKEADKARNALAAGVINSQEFKAIVEVMNKVGKILVSRKLGLLKNAV